MTFKKGGIKVMAFVLALAMALTVIPGLALAADLSPELRAAYDALTIHNADDVRESLDLPSVGENGAAITWASSDESIVSTEEVENEGYFPTPAGVVNRPLFDTKVTLTATLTLGGESVEKVFDLNVKAAPDNSVSALEVDNSDDGAYLFFYFTNNGKTEQQIFLAASQDGLRWKELNDRKPILTSTKGDEAVRDPYIIRSKEGDKFYLIATDLDASGNQWTDYQYNGSKDIVVWESTDLVNWKDQRMVTVSTDSDQGCTWAPEVTYDDETDEYVVYWSSKIITPEDPYYQKNVVYYATTRDFVEFSDPVRFIQGTLGMTGSVEPGAPTYDEPITVIDTTILKSEDDNKYYRVTKHELVNKVFMESSEHLREGYTTVKSNLYSDDAFAGVEGPELYRLEDGRYCLLLDRFGNGGYMASVTDDLAGGQFSAIPDRYFFPVARHGGVLRITDEEYERVMDAYYDRAEVKAPDAEGSGPVIRYTFDDGTAKDSVGNNDGVLRGNANVVEDAEMGKVLYLNGSADTYLELPQGFMDGRNELTVSMDVYNVTTGNYFNFGIGQDNIRYLFTKLMDNGIKLSLTTASNGGEESAEGYGVNMNGVWKNITFTVSEKDRSLRLYVDGSLYKEITGISNTIADLGKNTMTYIGKSYWSGDAYANMRADNVEIYNRALSADEIGEKYTPGANDRYGVTVDAANKGADITPGTVGLFFEDLNTAADGGIYSEQINNRSFEALDAKNKENNPTKDPDFAWETVGGATADYSSSGTPLNNNNKTYLTLTAAAEGDGIKNNCYSGDGDGTAINPNPNSKGMNAAAGAKYNASLFVRGDYDGEIKMQVVNGDKVIGDVTFNGVTDTFTKKFGVITVAEDCDDARVRVVLSKPGTVDLDMISLTPQQTFNGRDNGLRADLVEKLALLRPGFLRFPGGCIIEGYNLANRYQWKQTVGPEEQRVLNWNRWQTEGTYNYAYCQTYGLGFYEYFLLCEDIGAEPVPVLNVGLACQYQSKEVSSKEDFYSTYLPDFLDLIEFANGTPADGWEDIDYYAVDTANPETFGNNWANLRALMGHPESFDMKYIGVGNEQIDTSDYTNAGEDGWADNGNNFFARYEAIEKAVHAKYPEMKLISTSGPSADDAGDQWAELGARGSFSKAWNWINENVKENPSFTYAVDEHYYKQPNWFLTNARRYDSYDRDGAAVFAGEYASRWWANDMRGNTWESALSEAAFMTGLERNSDIVKMASFAPLFAKEGGHQWSPNMIWFDNADSYGSIDYYVQQMYSRNSGDYNVKTTVNDKFARDDDYYGIAGVGTWLTSAKFENFKVVDNETGQEIPVKGWQNVASGDFYSGGEWVIGGDGSATQKSIETSGDKAYLFADMEPITSNNYTVTVTATKLDGAEGFIIPVVAKDQDNLIHWNIGGWGNTQSAFERRSFGINSDQVNGYTVPVKLDNNRPYEIKIVVKDGIAYGYLDGVLLNQYDFTADPVYANSIVDNSTGDIIVKIANTSGEELAVPINIKNAADLTGKATEYLMTGGFLDKNSLAEPEKVAPQRSEIDFTSGEIYTMPAYSFAVLRIHTGGTVAVNKIDPVELTVDLDREFRLPENVTVYTGNGVPSERAVKWILPEAGVFANEGTFKVFGRVEGTELDAVALVTVVSSVPKPPVIDADIDALIDGEETVITFNPEIAGSYRGILAIYKGDSMESAQTVEFTGVNGEMTVKGLDLTGKTVKIMLWTADGLTPVADAVTVDPSANG